MVKRFGPVLGAGTVIKETESGKTIEPSAFGTTAMVGILERGEVGKLITCTGKRDLVAKTGGFISDGMLPDNAVDFWDHSEGSGILHLFRVTDGKEVKASLNLFDRKAARNLVGRLDGKNGGSWGGKKQTHVFDVTTPGTDILETQIKAPIDFSVKKDQLKGGKLKLTGANGGAGATYNIVSNDASDGTTTTNINLALDSDASTAYGVATDPEISVVVSSIDGFGQAKYLAAEIKDGVLNPATEFGIYIYLNGALVREYPDLSSDPAASNYWVEIINEDGSNHYVTATDLWTGAITADVRPANHFGSVASTEITATKLKVGTALTLVDSSLAGTNTLAAFTFGADVIADDYEIEILSVAPIVWGLTSLDRQIEHTFTAPADGVIYAADNPFSIGFTVTGVSGLLGEKFTVKVLPLAEDEAIGGKIYLPEVSGAVASGYLISDNTETETDIATGDLTVGGTLSGSVKYRLEYKQQFADGYDGIAEISTLNFLPAFDVNTSPFNETAGKGYGLIKFCTPGITEMSGLVTPLTVEKAGVAYAEATNHQYRFEIPKNITDETAAKTYVQDTLGKNTYEKGIFPSWAKVADPVLAGRLKDLSVSGMVLGRESLVAKNFLGYHKVAAGVDVTLPRIVRLPTADKVLNQEVLNPAGIPIILKKGGNFVIWGARIPSTDSAFKFCNHREQLSYYEHVFMEAFDFIIFSINNKASNVTATAAFYKFLLPEWRKGALRGDNPKQAFSIKIDEENNTDLTASLGNKEAEIKLKLAETTERFIISVGKSGIFEDLEA